METTPQLPPVPTAHDPAKFAAWQHHTEAQEEDQRRKRRQNLSILIGVPICLLIFVLALVFLVRHQATASDGLGRQTAAMQQAKAAVRLHLNFPETARFENLRYDLGDTQGPIVGGDVISTNAFGVPIRAHFVYSPEEGLHLVKAK